MSFSSGPYRFGRSNRHVPPLFCVGDGRTHQQDPAVVRLFVMIGLCGGYTTFSSFSLQTLDLVRAGAMPRAMLNIALSVTLCIAAVAVGHLIASRLNGGTKRIAQLIIEEEKGRPAIQT